MKFHLEGPGVNPHWNIHRSLEMLQGLQETALLLIEKMDNHIAQRDSGGGKHPDMIGNATAVIILTSYTSEISIKTLHAQIKPAHAPPRGHYLLDLYDAFDHDTKLEAQHMLETLPPIGTTAWIGHNPNMRELIKQGNSNFSDWRYLPEKSSMGGGVPKVLINVTNVFRELCLRHVVSLRK